MLTFFVLGTARVLKVAGCVQRADKAGQLIVMVAGS